MPDKYLIYFVSLFLVFFIALLTANFINYIKESESDLKKKQCLGFENVFVLAGGKGRIDKAYDIASKNGKNLIIVGASSKIDYKDIEQSFGIKESDKNKITIDFSTNTTYENVNFIKDYVFENNIKEITLVTSYFHMKRSTFLLKSILKNVKINKCHVLNEVSSYSYYRTFLSEYFKYKYYKLYLSIL
jgi:uncharacterized SAM-binding protein YcdF (DUF218 family)